MAKQKPVLPFYGVAALWIGYAFLFPLYLPGHFILIPLHLFKDLAGHLLQPHNIGGDAGIGDVFVQPLQFRDGKAAVLHHLIQFRIAGGRRLFLLLRLFR